jgi:hypothetical protein
VNGPDRLEPTYKGLKPIRPEDPEGEERGLEPTHKGLHRVVHDGNYLLI